MFQLRPFQERALTALKGRPAHVLCVASTGAGKSLIYERQAARRGTRTLLVTPLIALARQQLERFRSVGIEVTSATGRGDAPGDPPQGKSGAWIISPETLLLPGRRRQLESWAPNFLVVDECHCLWEWGERFRPAFHLLPDLLRSGEISRSLWLTATLPPHARAALRAAFDGLGVSLIEQGEFSLPANMAIEAKRISWSERSLALLSKVSELRKDGSGLIFVQTRESCERVARLLRASGQAVISYHAGLSAEERRNAESAVRSQSVPVVVATSAFGMGMDYAHLRWVVLWQAPPSLLSLAQAIGRAGRSAEVPSRACVFWDQEDFQLIDWMTQSSDQKKAELLAVARFFQREKCRAAELESYFNGQESDKICRKCDECRK
ncbi:MAG: helicase-related protein [Oligoflexia bacterium]|nr:helicase-related protein [Oligoflexia bacterium]